MKSLAEKLFLKKGKTYRLLAAPAGFAATLGVPEATLLTSRSKVRADIVIAFAHDRAELETGMDRAKQLLSSGGALWVAYPKGTSALKSDIHRDTITSYAETVGYTAVSIISIDETWSCLRLKAMPSDLD